MVGVAMAGVLRVPGDRKSPAIQAVWGDGEEPFCSCGLSLSDGECCLLREKSESEQGRTRTLQDMADLGG